MDIKTKQKEETFSTIALIVIAAVVLIGLGLYLASSNSSISGPVAVVNGEEIAGEELSRQLKSLRSATSTQAEQFNNLPKERQQEVLLEGMINTELQLQAAEAAGVEVTDEEVSSRLQVQIDQIGEEEFERRLRENNITRDELENDLHRQMLIDSYIQQAAGGEITPTDAEVRALYEQYTAQFQQASQTASPQVPSLSELRPQVEAAVVQQKTQQLAQELLETAREKAEIEVLLDEVSYPAGTGAPAATTSTTTGA